MYVGFSKKLKALGGMRLHIGGRGRKGIIMLGIYGILYLYWYMFLACLWMMYGAGYLMFYLPYKGIRAAVRNKKAAAAVKGCK